MVSKSQTDLHNAISLAVLLLAGCIGVARWWFAREADATPVVVAPVESAAEASADVLAEEAAP